MYAPKSCCLLHCDNFSRHGFALRLGKSWWPQIWSLLRRVSLKLVLFLLLIYASIIFLSHLARCNSWIISLHFELRPTLWTFCTWPMQDGQGCNKWGSVKNACIKRELINGYDVLGFQPYFETNSVWEAIAFQWVSCCFNFICFWTPNFSGNTGLWFSFVTNAHLLADSSALSLIASQDVSECMYQFNLSVYKLCCVSVCI